MSIDVLRATLGWAALINFGFLAWWFFFLVFAHDLTYRLTTRWFAIPLQQFDTLHYSYMAMFKLANLLFFVAPYLALRIVT